MKNKPNVCVVGSINMDMVTSVETMPRQGETVLGGTFKTNPGGKGANQAVAAARLGADVSFVGAIGADALGETILRHFENEGINSEGIEQLPEVSTGIATIIISEQDNRIIVASGANNKVTPELIEARREMILNSDVILLQFEIPMETIEYTVNLAYAHDIPVIINPAPYQEVPKEILAKATLLTPNEGEACSMRESSLYPSIMEKLIITKGKQGAEFYIKGEKQLVPAYPVEVKDTTGAGDTFNGALAVKLGTGSDLNEAVRFANAAAALSIGTFGAQKGMPESKEVEDFLKEMNN